MNTLNTLLNSIITSEQVTPRSYFLIELQTPEIIWAIRIGFIGAGLFALFIFIVMRRKTKDGE